MKSLLSLVSTVLLAFSVSAAAQDGHATKEMATSMVNAAVAHVKKVGAEQAYKDFNDAGNADWHKKDLYVFVNRFDGTTLAHGGNAKLIGKDMSGLKDQDGKLFIQEMIAVARKDGSGWVDYNWIHPETKKLAAKASFVRAVPGADTFVGAGIYR